MTKETRTTCPYCGVGCGIIASVDDDGRVSVKGDPEHPANFGRLCSKGSALAETLDQESRVLHPLIRGERATWDDALDLIARKFSQTIAEYGPDSVAFYISGQFLTEDYYIINKLMKGYIGSANVDTNSRLCMSSTVAANRRAFGSDTVPNSYEDLEFADLVVLVGSNLAWCHPVLYQRLAAEKARRPEMKVVVVETRNTMTADIADMLLLINPDGDVALFNGLLAHLAQSPAFDKKYVEAYTTGFDEALAAAQERSLADISKETGLTADELKSFYRLFEKSEKVVTSFSQGVNQSIIGTDKVTCIINCHLATGRIGKPGSGPLSLTGQPNAMGGREVGGLANTLAAHMNIEDESHRDIVGRFWNAPNMVTKPGLKAIDMIKAAGDGRIKALWIMATNPAVSLPDSTAVRTAIANCPFVVVSDIERNTDTTALAHVLLPATGWSEKDGLVTNSERRISRQRAFLPAPGEAKPDWWQVKEVARRMGFDEAFNYENNIEVYAEHAALSGFENDGKRDFDISALSSLDQAQYDNFEPLQWPAPAGRAFVESRFFSEGGFFTPDGRARFVPVRSRGETRTTAAYPYLLNSGRIRDQWHTMTRTGKVPRLTAHYSEPFVEISPRDAKKLGVRDADLVSIKSAHGEITVRALLTERQTPGRLFVPIHWNDCFSGSGRVDSVVASLVDPVSGQPGLKQVGVTVERKDFAFYGFAVSPARLRNFDIPYWVVAKSENGWRTELAWAKKPESLEDWCRRAFSIHAEADALSYFDRHSGQQRIAFFERGKLLLAIFLADEPVEVSRNWAGTLLGGEYSEMSKRIAVLAGKPGKDEIDPGATVCSCYSVGVNVITDAIAKGCHSVQSIGKATKAGTNCGSCRAEIRVILDAMVRHAAE